MQLIDLGRKSYEETLAIQKECVRARAADECEDTLILVEHDPVYTMGRATSAEEVLTEIKVKGLGNVPVHQVERGGKITFHGPGQLVGYPIFKLTHRDVRRYLQDLERVLISSLFEETAIKVRPCAETLLLEPGQLQTGVWVHDRKLASIGVAVKQWVSYHGFALNLSTDLRYFEAINPCGFDGNIMTTLQKEMQLFNTTEFDKVAADLKQLLIFRFTELSLLYSKKAEPMATLE